VALNVCLPRLNKPLEGAMGDGLQSCCIRSLHRHNLYTAGSKLTCTFDMPPENDTGYNLVKGGINSQKGTYPGTDHQQAQ